MGLVSQRPILLIAAIEWQRNYGRRYSPIADLDVELVARREVSFKPCNGQWPVEAWRERATGHHAYLLAIV